MKSGTPGFIGHRLSQALQARCMRPASLARMLDVSSTAVSNYRNGTNSPHPDVLSKMAMILGVKPEFFLQPTKPTSADAVFERSKSTVTKTSRMRARCLQLWLSEIVDYLSEHVVLPKVNLPDFGIDGDWDDLSDLDIEEFAVAARRYWQLGEGPISNITLLAEQNGVVVSRIQMLDSRLDAFSNWDSESNIPYIILGNDNGSAVRSRFDAAHELGHLLLHRKATTEQLEDKANFKRIENQAHRFAGAFLAPAQAFGTDALVPGLDTFRVLKPRWKISIKMMIKRCHDLDLVDSDYARRMYMAYNRRGWSKREPLDERMQPEHPTLLKQVFDFVSDAGVLAPNQIAADLPFIRSDVESLACLPDGYLNEDSSHWWAIPKVTPTG